MTALATYATARERKRERAALVEELSASARRSTRWSGWIAGGLLLLLLGLSAAPISGGAVAPGVLSTSMRRQAIQHERGGVIREILVAEGQHVEAGDVLVRLESVEAGAAAGMVATQILDLRAEEAVRLAEIQGLEEVVYPPDLEAAAGEGQGAAILAAHRAAFDARRARREVQVQQIDDRIAQTEQQIAAAEARMSSARAQLRLIRDEIEALSSLFDRGLVERSRVLALERTQAALTGEIQTAEASIGAYRASISELQGRREELAVSARAEAADALGALRTELAAALDRATAADNALARTTLYAPVSGAVVGRRVNTVGGVVGAGEVLMEIVPEDEGLVVRARVRPRDAEDVEVGAEAVVRFDYIDATRSPRVVGRVSRLSADVLEDAGSGTAYFEAVVELPPEAATALPAGALAPGLPVEVLIRSEARSVLSYLIAPLSRASFRAMREG